LKILYLGAPNRKISEMILKQDSLTYHNEKISEDSEILEKKEFVVSFGYRFILPASIVARFPKKIINLHISYLPWNRGADPNLWSFLEVTPSGVSIHQIDDGVDTGPILCQQKTRHDVDKDTLQSSYHRLILHMEDLFVSHWARIRKAEISPCEQMEKGSYHKKTDKNPYLHLLEHGWNTPVKNLIGKALQ